MSDMHTTEDVSINLTFHHCIYVSMYLQPNSKTSVMCIPHITWTVYLHNIDQYIFVLLLVYVHCTVSLLQGVMM